MMKILIINCIGLFGLLNFTFLDKPGTESGGDSRESIEFTVLEDSIEYSIIQVLDHSGFPLFYFSDIDQFPCHSENVCLMLKVRLYWDIFGNYLLYEMNDDEVLTKLNHKEFSDKDYKKLHRILNSPNSALRYCKFDDLTHNEAENDFYSIDAVTSATAKDLDFEYIGGAVKTTYTLWKIANGSPSREIKKITSDYFQQNDDQKIIDQEALLDRFRQVSKTEKLSILFKILQAGQPVSEDMLLIVMENLSDADDSEFSLLLEILQLYARNNKKAIEAVATQLDEQNYFQYMQAFNYLQKAKAKKYINKLNIKFRDVTF